MNKAHRANRPPWLSRAAIIALAVAVVAGGGVLTYALSGSSSGQSASGPGNPPTTVKGVTLDVEPPDGATNVGIDSVVSVSAMDGRLNSVAVTAPNGQAVAGAIDPTGQVWRSTGRLALQTTYSVLVDATSTKGRSMQQLTHFGSLVPAATLGVSIIPSSGLTVGVGQPLELRFDHSVVNKDGVIPLVHVTMSTPVPGGWHWFNDRELHFRPEQYWPSGEQVSTTVDLTGFDAGKGVWGTTSASGHFTVGDAHVSTANVATHEMTVTSNGAVVATYPISAGRTKYPTMNGVHIDLGKQQDVHMVSSSVGIPVHSADGYDEHVYFDVLITDSGEYVHAAPWSTGAQGNSNVSHGCINLSPANATAFYNFSRLGDIIIVTGSPRPASTGDHGTMDWTTPWSQFTPA